MVLANDPQHKLLVEPDISHIQIEDGAPVESLYAEKQARALVSALYTSWPGPPPRASDDPSAEAGEARPWIATSDVGVFGGIDEPPLVPDVLVSVDVTIKPDFATEKKNATYFIWVMGKAPDVVIEIVSNREGGELGKRKIGYQRWGVPHYVVWDPQRHLGGPELRAFRNEGGQYVAMHPLRFPSLGLALVPWDGVYEGVEARWLRWVDATSGELVPTGVEAVERERDRAGAAAARAETEAARADAEAARAEAEAARAERLAAKLRELGIDDA